MILTVNGERITDQLVQDEIKRLRPHYRSVFKDQKPEDQERQLDEWARENLIESVLLKQAAQQDIRPITEGVLKPALDKFIEEQGGADEFYKNSGLTEDDLDLVEHNLEQKLRLDRLLDEIRDKAVRPTKKEALTYYNSNPSQFIIPESVHAAHIVKHIEGFRNIKEAEQEIQAVWSRLEAGGNFEDLAAENSDCADDNGDLGVFPKGQMVEEFDQIVFSLEPGKYSMVFQTDFGYHIAKVYEHFESRKINFSEVYQQIIDKLLVDDQTRQIEQFVDQLKKTSRINYIPGNGKILKSLSTILIKPAGPDCNLDCGYCFYLEKNHLYSETQKHRMNLHTLEILIKQALQQSTGPVSFGWQGGEPTLMGLQFYKKVVDYQRRYGFGRKIGNSLQTNGILIDQDWLNFLKEYNFLVGLSLDGPEHIHDRYRQFRNGSPSWKQVTEKAKLMLEDNVAVNALSVVSDYSVKFPEEIYNFHKSLGLMYMQFIPVVESDVRNPNVAASYSVDQYSYGEFLCKIFDCWQADFKNGVVATSVRHIDSIFHTYIGQEAPECTMLKQCGDYIVVEHNGDVYSCDFFVEPDWKLGNLNNADLLIMLNSENQEKFSKLKSAVPTKCLECQWLSRCYGGCTKDRIRDRRDNGISHFCEAYKMFFQHADEKLKIIAKEWKLNHQQSTVQPCSESLDVSLDQKTS